jgi:adenylate cyclase
MAHEIERKFLVVSDEWKDAVSAHHRFTDGLIADADCGKVRVRISESACWLTLKGARSSSGLSRLEFEYPIPKEDAEAILSNFCLGSYSEKTRHCVPYRGVLWSVDVYHGDLEGLVFAEVELESEAQLVDMPNWVGREVTADPQFQKLRLFRLAREGIDFAQLLHDAAMRPPIGNRERDPARPAR